MIVVIFWRKMGVFVGVKTYQVRFSYLDFLIILRSYCLVVLHPRAYLTRFLRTARTVMYYHCATGIGLLLGIWSKRDTKCGKSISHAGMANCQGVFLMSLLDNLERSKSEWKSQIWRPQVYIMLILIVHAHGQHHGIWTASLFCLFCAA